MSISNIIEGQANHSLLVPLERLDQFALLDLPQLDGHIGAASDEVGLIT